MLALEAGDGLNRRGRSSKHQRSVLASVQATQQLDRAADILLSDSVADGPNLSVGKGRVASQNHEVEEHLASDGAWRARGTGDGRRVWCYHTRLSCKQRRREPGADSGVEGLSSSLMARYTQVV